MTTWRIFQMWDHVFCRAFPVRLKRLKSSSPSFTIFAAADCTVQVLSCCLPSQMAEYSCPIYVCYVHHTVVRFVFSSWCAAGLGHLWGDRLGSWAWECPPQGWDIRKWLLTFRWYLQTGVLVATLPGAWLHRVRTRTGWPSISTLWLSETASLIGNFYLSVAACTIVTASLSLRFTQCGAGMLRSEETNQPVKWDEGGGSLVKSNFVQTLAQPAVSTVRIWAFQWHWRLWQHEISGSLEGLYCVAVWNCMCQ